MMSCRWSKSKVIIALGLLLIALTVFCSSDKKTNVKDDDGAHPGRSTADGVLEALAYYYEAQDISGYDDVLCGDYLFVFTADVAESLSLPEEEPWWGKTEDLVSTANMFADTSLIYTKMDYVYVTDWDTCAEDGLTGAGRDTTYSGLCCRIEPDIRVSVRRPPYESYTLWVNDSWLDIMVVPDRYTKDCWCILRIQELEIPDYSTQGELTGSGAATEGTTWGAIKSAWK